MRIFFVCILLFAGRAALSQTLPADALRTNFEAELTSLLRQVDGVMGVWVHDLTDGYTWSHNADVVFPSASTIKTPILAALYEEARLGRVALDAQYTISASDLAGGAGILQFLGNGTVTLSLADLAVLMMVLSDNTATNLVIEAVGMERVNAFLERHGMESTRLRRLMIRPEDQRANRENTTTPEELGQIYALLHAGTLVDASVHAAVLRILQLPKSGEMRSGVPSRVPIAHKNRSLGGVLLDGGVVYLEGRPYVMTIMGTLLRDPDAAASVFTEAAAHVYRYFERLARSNAYGATVR